MKKELKTGWGITIPDEAYVYIDKKPYVKYPGLIGLGHKTAKEVNGYMTQTSYKFIQIPSTENGNVAIIMTTMSVIDKEGRVLFGFKGTGDASPRSVGSRIIPHIIRQAETRANARALRLLTDVGMTAVEELNDLKNAVNDDDVQPDVDYSKKTVEKPAVTEEPKPKSQERTTLEEELKKVKNECKIPDPILLNLVKEVTNKALTKVDELTENDLKALINRLKKEKKPVKTISQTKPEKKTKAEQPAEVDTKRAALITKIKDICKTKSLKPITVRDIAIKEFKIDGEFKAADLNEEQLSKLIEILTKFY